TLLAAMRPVCYPGQDARTTAATTGADRPLPPRSAGIICQFRRGAAAPGRWRASLGTGESVFTESRSSSDYGARTIARWFGAAVAEVAAVLAATLGGRMTERRSPTAVLHEGPRALN